MQSPLELHRSVSLNDKFIQWQVAELSAELFRGNTGLAMKFSVVQMQSNIKTLCCSNAIYYIEESDIVRIL